MESGRLPGSRTRERAAVGRDRREARDAAALLADLAAEGEHQDLAALHLDPVVVLREARLRHADRGAGLGDLPGQLPHVVGMHAGDRGRLLGGVAGIHVLAQHREDRSDLYVAVPGLDAELAFESGLQALERQGRVGHGLDLAAGLVEDIEDLLAASVFHVALAQEELVVATHQQRQVGLLSDERFLVQSLFDDHLRHREAQRCVAAGIHPDPGIRVHRRGVEVGCDGHDLRAPL